MATLNPGLIEAEVSHLLRLLKNNDYIYHPEVLRQWAWELLHTSKSQSKKTLVCEKGFCCLGIFTEKFIVEDTYWEEVDTLSSYFHLAKRRSPVEDYFPITKLKPSTTIVVRDSRVENFFTNLNDEQEYTFAQIGYLIKRALDEIEY
jgi:hypothetical protein